jgi:hypothetical protein
MTFSLIRAKRFKRRLERCKPLIPELDVDDEEEACEDDAEATQNRHHEVQRQVDTRVLDYLTIYIH